MKIYFGLELDDLVYPQAKQTEGGVHYFGPQGLLYMLESHLGLIGHPADNEYLRVEQYRQALRLHLELHEQAFFQPSFEADQFATATELLSRRDELLLSGWSFELVPAMPYRLKCLAQVEALFNSPESKQEEPLRLSMGFADRFVVVLEKLETRPHPISEIFINEPLDLLPKHFLRLFDQLEKTGAQKQLMQWDIENGNTDLAALQQRLTSAQKTKQKLKLKGDGSLMIVRSKRESDAAVFLAKLIANNPNYQPVGLIPDKSRMLDNALVQEGLPSMGIASASLARPTLQVLKLVPVFLWNPIDPFKIMEFVSLSVKPLQDDLANVIAVQMAQTPGLKSESWYIAINRFFDELQQRTQFDPALKVGQIRQQYQFWFERRRYDISKTVPKEEVVDIFNYLKVWAYEAFENAGSVNNSLLVLSEQAKRITELLEALPESQLTNLELERIVRTIYEPAPVQFMEAELGHIPYIHRPGGFVGPLDSLLWWNFTQSDYEHFFSRWFQQERTFLQQLEVSLTSPEDENALLNWHRKHPLLLTHRRLLLVVPQTVEGTAVHPHPLMGDLEATFSNPESITFNLDKETGKDFLARFFQLPKNMELDGRQLGRPKPFLNLKSLERLDPREQETFTSLQSLFYYPYQWVFRHKIKLKKSSILSVVKDVTLMGNLSHRFFEGLFSEEIQGWDKNRVENWIDNEADRLLSREGAVLQMYGREPERVGFIQRVKYAAWSLVKLVQENGWKVQQTEKSLEGRFLGVPVNGRADLVLEKNGELAVIDLKWRGASRRERIIRNEEDLQLVLYSKLLTDDHTWAHTAYFIMQDGKMIARNELAFKNITVVNSDADHVEVNERILDKMQQTYRWRMEQIKEGKIEIRCQQTEEELEETYGPALLDLLEMKSDDAPFDDYRTLINLIE